MVKKISKACKLWVLTLDRYYIFVFALFSTQTLQFLTKNNLYMGKLQHGKINGKVNVFTITK